METKFYTTKEFADLTRVTDRHVRALIASKQLDHIRLGKAIRIPATALKVTPARQLVG